MVWRKVTIWALAMLLILAMPTAARAAAATPYDGTISTTYITIFRDIAAKIGINDDYVFYRSGQYEYCMVVGDLDNSPGAISAAGEVTIYAISTNSSSYSSGYEYTVTTQTGFSLTPGSALVYSNLGNYPDLIERNDYYAFATLALLFVALCCYLLRSVFGFCLRRKG